MCPLPVIIALTQLMYPRSAIPLQFQALPQFLAEYPNITFATQKAYYAMVSTVDSSVRNLTDALKVRLIIGGDTR